MSFNGCLACHNPAEGRTTLFLGIIFNQNSQQQHEDIHWKFHDSSMTFGSSDSESTESMFLID
jgi:hypothetical protein